MTMMSYNLDDKLPRKVLWLSSLQWFVFTFANLVTVPIVLGFAFGMTEHEIALMTSRTMLISGAVSLLQTLIGHRFAIVEGPAGMWWGLFLMLFHLNVEGKSVGLLLRELEWGMMAGSAVFIVLGLTGLLSRVRTLFTPSITGTFLILATIQVSRPIIEGMLGVGYRGSETVRPFVALSSIFLIALTVGIMRKGKGIFRNISILISMLAGWLLYAVLGWGQPLRFSAEVVALPDPFPFGAPVFNWGIVITCTFTAVILLSNLISSIQAFAAVTGAKVDDRTYSRGSVVTGIGTFLSGFFGIVGILPITSASSLVALTGIAARVPLMLSSAAIASVGLFPSAGQLLAGIPAPVCCAVMFTVFGQLIGIGLRDFKTLAMDQRDIFIVGFAVLGGLGSLFVPGKVWTGLPPLFGFVFGNGVILGILVVIVLEHLIFRKSDSVIAEGSKAAE